jgi:hypothetical protein
MNFSIRAIINRLLAPQHEVSCPAPLWSRLTANLQARGHGYHESGAFLLGTVASDGRRRIQDYLLYDDLDPHALDTGIVRLDGRYFGRLWDICKAKKMTVVADVHTHPAGSGQSPSDQAHPIISRAGHVAFIVPNFASAPVRLEEVGMYRYLGGHRWDTVPSRRRKHFLYFGF